MASPTRAVCTDVDNDDNGGGGCDGVSARGPCHLGDASLSSTRSSNGDTAPAVADVCVCVAIFHASPRGERIHFPGGRLRSIVGDTNPPVTGGA